MTAIDKNILHRLLEACDAKAVENVRANRGGPFAASVHVYNQATGDLQTIVEPVGNAVIETGLASAHAEDRAIVPENVVRLRQALAAVGRDHAHVYVISSAESCPACHAKLEILARKLVHERIILPGNFTVIYGASYEDSKMVAGFDDDKYHHDFQLKPGTGLVKQGFDKLITLPERLKAQMGVAPGPMALIPTKDRVLVGAGESPEIAVIKMASMMQRRVNIEEPWNLRRATLYTFTHEIGPMAYAECQWANIGHWISVEHPSTDLFETLEAPDVNNSTLFQIIATRPYTHADSAMHVVQLKPFANLGQHEWASKADRQDYNGA